MKDRRARFLAVIFCCLGAGLMQAVELPTDPAAWSTEGKSRIQGPGRLAATGDGPISLRCVPDHPWNLSAGGEAVIRLANPGTVAITGQVRLETDLVNGTGGQGTGAFGKPIGFEPYQRFAQRRFTIAPGATDDVPIPLRRVPFSGPIPMLSGIRTCPPELRNRLDPSEIVRLEVRLDGSDPNRQADVLALTVRGTPELLPAELPPFLPWIDRFGQYRHRDWPGKVHDDADLVPRLLAEDADLATHQPPSDWNAWGGSRSARSSQAGDGAKAFHTERIDGRWHLIDPDGGRFWSQGVCAVGTERTSRIDGTVAVPHTIIDGRDGWFEADLPKDPAWAGFIGTVQRVHAGPFAGKGVQTFNFPGANLARKHGPDWEAAFVRRVPDRLRSWGFNTLGNWTQAQVTATRRMAYTLGIPTNKARPIAAAAGHWGYFPDPWGDLAAVATEVLDRQPDALTDPWCIGYFIGNELSWGGEMDLACAVLASPADQPAKQRFIAVLQERFSTIDALNARWKTGHATWEALAASTTPPDRTVARDELVAFNAMICDAYYASVVTVIRAKAPGRLVLGSRFVLGWGTAQALDACQRHCDVVSFNVYSPDWSDVQLPAIDAPILISEYGTGAPDRGLSTGHLFAVKSQAERAAWILRWQRGARADPRIVGMHWFQFRDESVAGRAHDGEDFNCGLVDVADNPYPETIAAFRAATQESAP